MTIDKVHMPSDSYANAFTGCLHAGEGAGRACMNDSVVNQWTADGASSAHRDFLLLSDR